ncbi:MAG: sugar ABC transporter permease [Clostridiales bacterium]|nr:sugar ABC transporter permease [Clostridiales bacterium]
MSYLRKLVRSDRIAYLFVAPALCYMLLLVGYPILYNLLLSVQDVTVKNINNGRFSYIGLDNYVRLFTNDVLTTSIVNTLVFTVACIIAQFLIGFLLALFFNRAFRAARFVRGMMMMPWMIPMTVTALMFKFMFSTNVGIVNQALLAAGLIASPIDWLTSPVSAMIAVIAANVWIGIPFNMILLSVGLTTIPAELYESASIDGAGRWQSFRHITLPLLRPTIESVLVLGFIYTFKVFDLVFVMTNCGPVNATQLLSTYSYKLSFSLFKYSEGSAVANVLFVILLAASLVYLKYTYTEEEGM